MKKAEEVGVGEKEGKGGIYTPRCKRNKKQTGGLKASYGSF